MTHEILEMLATIAVGGVLFGCCVWLLLKELRELEEFQASLPTYEEALEEVRERYPDYVDECEYVCKSTYSHGGNHWMSVGSYYYSYYLVCKRIGITIQVKERKAEQS